MSKTQVFINVLTLLTTIANIVIAVCACIGLYSWKHKLSYDKATLKRKKVEELNLIVGEFDNIFKRLNPSYAEIPNLLAKLDKLKVYINTDFEMGKALDKFYNVYENMHMLLKAISNTPKEKQEEIFNIYMNTKDKIKPVTNILKNLITKELK